MPADLRVPVVALLAFAAATAASAQAPPPPASAQLAHISRDVACAPVMAGAKPEGAIKVVAGRDLRKTLFSPGETIVISGGTAQGLRNGDEFFVRRIAPDRYQPGVKGQFQATVHTAGAVQITEVHGDSSFAVVTYGCDGIMEGDFLERFEPVALPQTASGTTPDFAHPGKLILAADQKSVGAPGEFLIVDRGTDHGVRVGQKITVFRPTVATGGPVSQVAEARVYAVAAETATIRIESSVDAVHVGDLIAIHR